MKKRKGSPSTWFYSEEGKENHNRIFGKIKFENKKLSEEHIISKEHLEDDQFGEKIINTVFGGIDKE